MVDRDRMIRRALSKKVTIDEFNFDTMTAPPLLSRFTPTDIGDLYTLASSVKYSSKLKFKYDSIDAIMARRGCEKFVSGTNRITYRPYDSNKFLYKIAFDNVGLGDNPAEFKNQQFLKPFVTKLFETDPMGAIACVERVTPITNREEFMSVAKDVYQAINSWFVGEYVLADFGSKFFMNWGVRDGFGPVLLDFPYVYKLDGSKLFCRAKNPYSPTGCCEGEIDYDAGYNKLRCTRCGIVYKANELKKKEKEGTLFVKQIRKGELKMKGRVSGGSKNIAAEGVTFGNFVQQMEVNTVPANAAVKEAPKEEETSEVMTVNGAVYNEDDEKEQAKKLLDDIAKKKEEESKEDDVKEESIIEKSDLIPGGTGREGGVNVISFKKEEEEKPFIDQIPEFFDKIREFMKDCSDEEKSKVWDLIETLYQDTTAADKEEVVEEPETVPGGTGREDGINVISFKKEEEHTVDNLINMFNEIAMVVESTDDQSFREAFLSNKSVLEFIDNNFIATLDINGYTKDKNIIKMEVAINIVPEHYKNADIAVLPQGVVWNETATLTLNEEDDAAKGFANNGEVDGKRYTYERIIMMDSAIVNISDFAANTESRKVIIFIDPDTNDYFVTKEGDLVVADIIDGYEFNDLSLINKDYLANLIDLEKRQMNADEAKEEKDSEESKEAPESEIPDEEEEVKAEE